jgi:3-isopropylmalate/(R)-2-methylmalate dehydratase small subunit
MDRFEVLEAVAVPIPEVNCDTDQIIPARYLQKLRAANFGDFLFADLRFDQRGAERTEFPMNRQAYKSAQILVGGENFGCGSSREHAVWALHDYGIRALIAASFGDIFTANCLKNGLLPIVLPAATVGHALSIISEVPGTRLIVDLPNQFVKVGDDSIPFEVDAFAKECLVQGLDELGYTLSLQDEIQAFEQRTLNGAGH